MSQIVYSNDLEILDGESEDIVLDMRKGSGSFLSVAGANGAQASQIRCKISAVALTGKSMLQIGSNSDHKITLDSDTGYESVPLLWIIANSIKLTAYGGATSKVRLLVEEVI